MTSVFDTITACAFVCETGGGSVSVSHLTFCAAPPELAAHSRSADIVISRLMMMVVGMARADRERGNGGLMHNRMRVVATLVHDEDSTGSHSLKGRVCGAHRE